MSNYSKEQQKEFEEYHQGIKDIQKKIKDREYLKLNSLDKAERIAEAIKDISNYWGHVPEEVMKKHKISEEKIKKMLDDLVEVKNKL